MRWLLFLAPLLPCLGQPLPTHVLLLGEVKRALIENAGRLPNYTCSESIERGQKLLSSKNFQTHDLVRLEVAIVEGHEVYGWPGANRIEKSELSRLVGGTIGNGDFGTLVKSIFLGHAAKFQFLGPDKLDQHSLKWSFRVPVASSDYRLRVPPREAVVGYHGAFWIDAGTFDLVRLELAADDIPQALGLRTSRKTIEYRRTAIGSNDFLLPKNSELAMSDFKGIEIRNRTTFHDCRQYAGESVLSFDEPSPGVIKVPAVDVLPVDLPDNFAAELSLLTPINSETAAVGDPIQVRLEENLKSGHKLIAPKGAILTGRITQLHRRQQAYHVGFSLHSLDFKNSHADLSGRENTIFAVTRMGVSLLQSSWREGPAGRSLIFEATRLQLPKGLLFYLKSRLVKSDKQ